MNLLEIDRLIAKHYLGWEFRKPTHGRCCTCQRCGRCNEDCWGGGSCEITDNLEAAWAIFENHFIKDGCAAWLEGDGHTGYRAGCTSNKGRFEANADTAPLAICYALLRAAGYEVRDAVDGE